MRDRMIVRMRYRRARILGRRQILALALRLFFHVQVLLMHVQQLLTLQYRVAYMGHFSLIRIDKCLHQHYLAVKFIKPTRCYTINATQGVLHVDIGCFGN